VGDSYNDISMMKEADKAFLFRPPDNVKKEFPEFPVSYEYSQLKSLIKLELGDGAK
jgi:phosphoserine/homoserine phosphotransferase